MLNFVIVKCKSSQKTRNKRKLHRNRDLHLHVVQISSRLWPTSFHFSYTNRFTIFVNVRPGGTLNDFQANFSLFQGVAFNRVNMQDTERVLPGAGIAWHGGAGSYNIVYSIPF
jgi:hypothetical protein